MRIALASLLLAALITPLRARADARQREVFELATHLARLGCVADLLRGDPEAIAPTSLVDLKGAATSALTSAAKLGLHLGPLKQLQAALHEKVPRFSALDERSRRLFASYKRAVAPWSPDAPALLDLGWHLQRAQCLVETKVGEPRHQSPKATDRVVHLLDLARADLARLSLGLTRDPPARIQQITRSQASWAKVRDRLEELRGSWMAELLAAPAWGGKLEGTWQSDHGKVTFVQRGTSVDGTWYGPDGNKGKIEGTLAGGTLSFHWRLGPRAGTGSLTLTPDGARASGYFEVEGGRRQVWKLWR